MTLQIIILDGEALNPGDLSWGDLEQLGELTVYPQSEPSEVVSRAINADAVFTNKVLFNKEVLSQLPKLKYIGIFATGYNVVDLDAARQRGIPVTNIPGYSTESVAQLTWSHLLNLTFRLSDHDASVKQGDWSRCANFCYWNHSLVELFGLTFGTIGYGAIGRRVAKIADAFGMNVLAYTPRANSNRANSKAADHFVRMVDLESLLKQSDVVSLHCPLTSENQKMINAETLALMKPTAFLLNVSRGLLVDEQALADALNSGHLAGAGLDVLSQEPPDLSNPLFHARNCFFTPHIAWATLAARKRLLKIAVENFRSFLNGKTQNDVTAIM
ncbi:MAG: D-2-hydroxyacid dehydrogenase [Planctomycetaceae bacterium]|jgi:glycerate dehydrogenase|nr:D-2-hydroxyacid dehydrogenase [Planctomycetaceae bacterium]